MAKQDINLGTGPNTGTGDPIRTAFGKAKSNFDELYQGQADAATALGSKLTEAQARALLPVFAAESVGRPLTIDDHGKTLRYTGSSAATFTLPSGLPVGFTVAIRQAGTGKVTVAAGSNATAIAYPASQLSTAGQNATLVAAVEATNQYYVSGQTGA